MNPYRFFNGEAENPYNSEMQPHAAMFWDYESIFEARYKANGSNRAVWEDLNLGVDEDKEDIFEQWLLKLLTEILPGKHEENEPGTFVRLYWETQP